MNSFKKQSGATLIVGLVMLVILTLMVVSSFNFGKTNLDIVSNMQHRNEVTAAAQQAIELAISDKRFYQFPDNVFTNPCNGSNTLCVDVNGDETNDITITLNPDPANPGPQCLKSQSIPNEALDVNKPEDLECSTSPQQLYAVEGAVTGASRCANTTWEITAEAEDLATEAKAVVSQGVNVRVDVNDIATTCPVPAV